MTELKHNGVTTIAENQTMEQFENTNRKKEWKEENKRLTVARRSLGALNLLKLNLGFHEKLHPLKLQIFGHLMG